MSDVSNINKLIKAEREANDKINDAERQKSDLLEQAKHLAEVDSRTYKTQKDEELKARNVDTTAYENRLQKEVDTVKAQNKKDYDLHREAVIQMIADKVVNVNLQLQRNVIGDYAAMHVMKEVKKSDFA